MAHTDVLRNQVVSWAAANPANRARLVRDPKGVVEEVLGIAIPDDTRISVLEETTTQYFLVLPAVPGQPGSGTQPEDYKY